MKTAIMQPYIFPYFGYYQMVAAVDKFIFLDDVNFTKKSFMSRNKVGNEKEIVFSVPLKRPSQNVKILNTLLSETYDIWKSKFLTTLECEYRKYPNYSEVVGLIKQILKKDHTTLSDLSCESVKQISRFLGIQTDFLYSSDIAVSGTFDFKLINTCKKVGSQHYINSIGGIELYDKDKFLAHDIKLEFIESKECYGYMSIIDVLMKNDINLVRSKLCEVEFV